MHKVISTPDVLNEIFLYLSRHTHTIAARVCRLWFTHSIQFIWSTVGVNNILAVLSPFDDDGFKQPLLSESWRRFLLYSRHIRTLGCWGIQYSALRQALLWSPNVDLFSSKLTVLYWNGRSEYIEYLPPLVTSTLQILKVQLDIIERPNTLDVLHQTILLRLPPLHSFELSFPPVGGGTEGVSRSLAGLFSLLSELVFIHLPCHCMTEKLFTALSRLPQLQHLSLSYLHSLSPDDNLMKTLPKKKIDDDQKARKDIPFCSLGKIDIDLSDSDFMMTEVLQRGIRLLELVDLTYSGHSDHTMAFMESLHKICPNLKKITIFAPDGLPFRSLLKCPALVKIVSGGDVDMKFEDSVTIATNRSSWQVITLPSVKPLSFQALVPFAQNCPDLYELGLTFNSKLGIPDLHAFTRDDVKFSSLTLLTVGFSEPTSDFGVVLFLSKLFSNPIEIKPSLFFQERHRLWKTLEKLLNFIISTQLEIRTLKDENTLLLAQKCNHDF
ncbi:hypothetical protein Clacol_002134 [Clathrus columnatus]|uniref:F-box domain-containing protein n=1 Tax=Clathrus columnatus TaxID=1419009 RepID=A0AAV5A2T2_9AGAM|nr:hypothetical protein Clacol_002134 [Clathrus columnatus]